MRRLVLAVLALFLVLPCVSDASMRRVEPGQDLTLAADEALVLMAVDTDTALRKVAIKRDGRLFGSGSMRHPPAGQSYELYVTPAGRYGWSEVRAPWFRWRLDDDEDFVFEAKAGTVTYPGDLVVRTDTLFGSVESANRSLPAMDWLEQAHPGLARRYPLTFTGRYPDPFPAFHRSLPTVARPPDGFGWVAPPPPRRLPSLGVADLWRAPTLTGADLNGEGRLVLVRQKVDDTHWTVELIDLQKRVSLPLVRTDSRPTSLAWVGDRHFILTTKARFGPSTMHAFAMTEAPDAPGGWSAARADLPFRAELVRVLAGPQPAVVIASRHSGNGEPMLHRLDLADLAAVKTFKPRWNDRLNADVDDDIGWLVDAQGVLRLVLQRSEDGPRLLRVDRGAVEDLLPEDEDLSFDPVLLSPDLTTLYGIASEGRPQAELVAMDLATRVLKPTVFAKPGRDVVDVITGPDGGLAGVRYLQGGRIASEYFDVGANAMMRSLEQAFPGRTVAVYDRSLDGRQLTIWVDGSDTPPTLFHFDRNRNRAAPIALGMPWLDGKALAPTRLVEFKARDGLQLEAFLTLPPGVVRPPLVVNPHGGPIGVSDTVHFNPEVQWMAALGYAVLRVNFRGSVGYGREVLDGATGNFGRMIEDDIDAAVQAVVASGAVDPDRMCMVGSSYGGYSGLVAAVRWPTRYRCVVSIAGPSDLALLFTAGDLIASEAMRQEMEKVIGDPRTQMARLQETSPLYHADAIRADVMLVHGGKDRRVDPEHARRIARVLAAQGRTVRGLFFEDEGHGIDGPDNQRKAWEGIAGFLQSHLDPFTFSLPGMPEAATPPPAL